MRRYAIPELLLSALCFWAAWYHTPAGALVRGAGAWLLGARSSARPLLSYYGAGVHTPVHPAALPLLPAAIPPGDAAAYGAWTVLAEDVPAGFDAGGIRDRRRGPGLVRDRLEQLERKLGSRAAALLALFAGEEPARYALEAAGAEATLEDLARALPPGYADGVSSASRAAMLGGAYALGWPLPESAQITSPFGERQDPMLGRKRLHAGVDLGVAPGTVVRAAGSGIVRRASADGLNGRSVVLDHGGGVVTVYCHNQELLVRDGQRVERGQPISRSGNTGRSTGPHLHYQIDLAGQPVDPLRFRSSRPRAVALGGTD